MKRIFNAITGSVFLGIGSVVLYFLTQTILVGLQSLGWPAVTGRVLESHVAVVSGAKGSGFEPRVSYTYAVGGATYKGSTLTFAPYSSNTPLARHAVAAFPAGKDIPVRYDPLQPQRSVLQPGVNWFACVMALMGVLFSLVGLDCLIWGVLRVPTPGGQAA